jgi:hypothetical protein
METPIPGLASLPQLLDASSRYVILLIFQAMGAVRSSLEPAPKLAGTRTDGLQGRFARTLCYAFLVASRHLFVRAAR